MKYFYMKIPVIIHLYLENKQELLRTCERLIIKTMNWKGTIRRHLSKWLMPWTKGEGEGDKEGEGEGEGRQKVGSKTISDSSRRKMTNAKMLVFFSPLLTLPRWFTEGFMAIPGMPDTQKNSKVVKFHFLLLFFANWAILSQKMKKIFFDFSAEKWLSLGWLTLGEVEGLQISLLTW